MATSGARQRAKVPWFWIGLVVVVVPVAVGATFILDHYWRSRFTHSSSGAPPPEPPREEIDTVLLKKLEQTALPADETAAGPGDWPQWRGPLRNGRSAETNLLLDWPAGGPPVLWRAKSGPGYSSLAIAAGQVYTLVQQGSQENVVCWDADTGAEKWRFAYEGQFGNIPGPRSTPAVDQGRVYAVGGTGLFHCLDAATGELLWKHDLLNEYQAHNLQWGVSFSPLVDGNLVLTNPGGSGGRSLVAFDKITGEERWHSFDDGGGYSSPIVCSLAGRKQIVFFTAKHVVGVAPADGRVLWQFKWETNFDCNAATPIALGDYVFISSNYGKGCALLEITPDLEVKPVYQHNRMRNHFATCVHYQEHLYGFDEANLACMDLRTGKTKWSERGFDKGSLLIADGHLIVLGEHGKLAVAEATPAGLRLTASFVVSKEKCWTAPVIAHGCLYVRDEKEVVCLDLRRKKA
jgi:outer membrane protein assembly factor BamB